MRGNTAPAKAKTYKGNRHMRLLLESEIVSKALRLATAAHSGQVDKAGVDYIRHPIAVAESLNTEEEQTAALLHDVVEDTTLTLEDLKREGFSDRVLDAVQHLTHGKNESREAYLRRVKENPLAVRIKLADLAHNSDLSRIKCPTEKDVARVERYKKEAAFLTES